MIAKLQKLLKVQKEFYYIANYTYTINIDYATKLDRVKAEYKPAPISELIDEDSIFDYLDSEKNLLVHHPYQSFDVVIRFLQEAANDPKVISIRQTLYRVSSKKSPVIKALCDAARNGKHVTVMLELLARFDEQQNIELINILKEAGCNVMYSLEELKTHCKICVVTRKCKGNLINYAHVSTGNYNEKTSKIYTDISYFTNDQVTCEELITVFNYSIGFPVSSSLTKVSYSPATILPTMIERLRAIPKELMEFENQTEEPRAVVSIKVNSINNFEFIKTVHDLATEFAFIEFRII
jgi:polyphosphate kinase